MFGICAAMAPEIIEQKSHDRNGDPDHEMTEAASREGYAKPYKYTSVSEAQLRKECDTTEKFISPTTRDIVPTGQDILSHVLPSELGPPKAESKPELLEQIEKWHGLMAKGGMLLQALRRNKNYRNPEYLRKKVDEFDIYQYGTMLPQEVFDPANLPQDDYIEELKKKHAEEDARKKKIRANASTIGTARIEFQPPSGQKKLDDPRTSRNFTAAAVAAAQAKAAALARETH